MSSFRSSDFTFLVLAVACFCPAGADDVTDEARRQFLIDGFVLDADTAEPIKSFRVLPGTRYSGDDDKIAVWQPHLIRAMENGVFQWPRTRGYKEMRFRVEADGYRPATTHWLGVGGPYTRLKVRLRRDPGIKIVVRTPSGSPADNATIAIGLPNRGIRLDGCQVAGADDPAATRLVDQWRRPQTVRTNATGAATVPHESDPVAILVVAHPDGFVEMPFQDLARSYSNTALQIKLKPWASIRGQVIWKDKPGVGEVISGATHRDGVYPGLLTSYPTAVADDQGNYVLNCVLPGQILIGHRVTLPPNTKVRLSGIKYEYPVFSVDVESGQTADIDFGGAGKTVTGTLKGVDAFSDVTISIQPPAPDVKAWIKVGNAGGANDMQKGFAALRGSEYARLYFRGSLPVADDGTFRIENVMTGTYSLTVTGSASGSASFTVTSLDESEIDLSTIQVQPADTPTPDGV